MYIIAYYFKDFHMNCHTTYQSEYYPCLFSPPVLMHGGHLYIASLSPFFAIGTKCHHKIFLGTAQFTHLIIFLSGYAADIGDESEDELLKVGNLCNGISSN